MSVKFEIKDWRFEITWRELAVTPRARRKAEEKPELRNWLRWQPALAGGTLNPAPHTHHEKEGKTK